MRLQIHRKNYGVDPDGNWHQKIDGDWCEIEKPEWADKKKEQKQVVDISEMRMSPPSKKHKEKYVKVYRVIEKTVLDYEAEVLCRNGWQDYYPGTLRHNMEDAGSTELQVG